MYFGFVSIYEQWDEQLNSKLIMYVLSILIQINLSSVQRKAN